MLQKTCETHKQVSLEVRQEGQASGWRHYLSTGAAVMASLCEGEFGLTLHAGGSLRIWKPDGGELAQVRDGHVDVSAHGGWGDIRD